MACMHHACRLPCLVGIVMLLLAGSLHSVEGAHHHEHFEGGSLGGFSHRLVRRALPDPSGSKLQSGLVGAKRDLVEEVKRTHSVSTSSRSFNASEQRQNTSCSGWAPSLLAWAGAGSSCGLWGWKTPWCYVDANYTGPGSEFLRASAVYEGKFFAPCGWDGQDFEQGTSPSPAMPPSPAAWNASAPKTVPAAAPPPPPPVQDGQDKSPQCAAWAERGECARNAGWMSSNCAFSCGASSLRSATVAFQMQNVDYKLLSQYQQQAISALVSQHVADTFELEEKSVKVTLGGGFAGYRQERDTDVQATLSLPSRDGLSKVQKTADSPKAIHMMWDIMDDLKQIMSIDSATTGALSLSPLTARLGSERTAPWAPDTPPPPPPPPPPPAHWEPVRPALPTRSLEKSAAERTSSLWAILVAVAIPLSPGGL
eukprot:TRINITY_DN29072_c0_g1_i1.p1 TRINITY_DN29072_c0_g1~~TRINITY_DN29072_c0_g1_i1.p1  ORF type:complete len:425 (+),score=94.78 TRINITY_DN29072_c0_g1_i1:132-1406(+)